MPTIVTKTVKPSGGDYTSLSAWEAGQQGDIVTADQIQQAECYSMQDTTQVVIDGWTTDATRYIKIYTPGTERHDGKWNPSKYRLDVDGTTYGLDLVESFIRIDGIQLQHTYSTGSLRGMLVRPPTGEFQISNCVFKGALTGTASGRAIEHFDTSTLKIWNCIFQDWKNGATASCDGVLVDNGGSTCYLYNNTAYNCLNGFRRASGTALAKNCLTQSCTDGFNGTFSASSTNNCSDITSDAPGSSTQTGSVTFVDTASGDFHLAASDTVAKDHGADLSADANLAFSDDIDGTTRPATWDIGADEAAAAVVNVPSGIGWRNRQNPRLRGPIKQSRFQRTQLWSTAAPGSTVNGNGASASSFVTVGQLSGVGNLTGKSAMTIQSAGSGSGTAAMSGASSVTINTRAAGSGNGALTGASSVTINTRAAGSGKGALSGAGSVTINTSGAGSGKAALAGQSTFTISTGGTLTSSAIGSMIGRSVFGFAARVSGAGLANMTGNSGISESSAAAGSGKAAMTGRSTFSFAPQIFLQALTPISGRSQMNLVLRGLMTGLTPPKPSWLELPLSNAYRANEISSTPRDNRIESEYRDNRITTEEAR